MWVLVCMAGLAAGSVVSGWSAFTAGILAVAGPVVLVLVVLTEEPGEAAVRAGEQGWGGDAVGGRLESAAPQGRGGGAATWSPHDSGPGRNYPHDQAPSIPSC
ncbi:hypothetical protein GCM10010353_71200 [Streptomyces chryseus]|nr:hypothetical protein GCM10010353_71200 [Streptomyces chryseus]